MGSPPRAPFTALALLLVGIGVPTVTRALPDLRIASLDAAPEPVLPGQPMSVTSSVENVGADASGTFRVGYYLSADDTCTPADEFLGSLIVSQLGPGASTNATTDVTLPGATPGPHWMCGIADDELVVVEVDEGNNTALDAIEIVECTADSQCQDGIFCNGPEVCSANACAPGTPPDCDDGVTCTIDSCNAIADACSNAPNHGACDNAVFCDGAELCNLVLGCVSGGTPSCDDGVACTADTCDAVADACVNAPVDASCEDGDFCTDDYCIAGLGCADRATCAPYQQCDEAADQCLAPPAGSVLGRCGDLDLSGVVDGLDVDRYRQFLADPPGLPLSVLESARCDVRGVTGDCDVADVAVLRRALAAVPLAPGIAPVCAAAPRPVHVRTHVMVCGAPARDAGDFVPEGLRLPALTGCAPTRDTQALLVVRGGTGSIDPTGLRVYVEDGGIVVGERSVSDELYNAVFEAAVAQSPADLGDCGDNVNVAVRDNENDPFWLANGDLPLQTLNTGCGFDLSALPGITPLGGWSAPSTQLAYRDRGDGRLWLVEADWGDGDAAFGEASRRLMEYMLLNGARRKTAHPEIRPNVRLCGTSVADAGSFLRPGLGLGLSTSDCDVAGASRDDTQALLVTRDGAASFVAGEVRDYVAEGGIVITEFGSSDEVYNAVFAGSVIQGAESGSCQDNVTPVERASLDDPFWVMHQDQAVPLPADSGCGHDLSAYPGLTPLGGPDPATVHLAYRDLGSGRLWLVEKDWQDGDAAFSEDSRRMMEYMVLTGARHGRHLRPRLMVCGALARNARRFLPEGLDRVIESSCVPDPSTQAMLITGSGVGQYDAAGLQAWVRAGGIVVAGLDATDEVFNDVFDEAVAEAVPPVGVCLNEINPAHRANEGDAFWEHFAGAPAGSGDGCGPDMAAFPDVTGLGGMEPATVTLGYRDLGRGRVWLASTDWEGGAPSFSETSRQMMEYMILSGSQRRRGTFSGVRVDAPLTELLGAGYEVCYADTYDASEPLANVMAGCTGDLALLACRPVGAADLTVGALGESAAVVTDVGTGQFAFHPHNGAGWYFSPNYSWGFFPLGESVSRTSCDTIAVSADRRLCWHTAADQLVGGWRCGSTTDLNGSAAWERLILHRPGTLE